MIVHVHADGSEGFEYQPGDRVRVTRTIPGGWFDVCPVGSDACCVVKVGGRRFDDVDVKWSDDWGSVACKPWHLIPHAQTLAQAKRVSTP